MKAEYYWWLREKWHLPQMMKDSYKSSIRSNLFFIHYSATHGKWNLCYMDIKRLLHNLRKRIFWGFLWMQPFRCPGCGKRDWRIRLCEWLEDTARAKDEQEEKGE